MRTELVHGRWLLCGVILKADKIKAGQVWAPADGHNYTVRVFRVHEGWVNYEWDIQGKTISNEKGAFSFQCRYCLVLDGPKIPKELM